MKRWQIVRTLNGHSDMVMSLSLSPNGKLLASASKDFTVKLWEVETGELIHTLVPPGIPEELLAVAISPDVKRLVAGGKLSTIIMWPFGEGDEGDVQVLNHSKWVSSLAFSPDGLFLISADLGGTAKIWSARKGTLLQDEVFEASVSVVAVSPDGEYIAGGGQAGVKLRDLATARTERYNFVGHRDYVTALAFSPDSKTLISGDNEGVIKVWSLLKKKDLLYTITGHSRNITDLVISSDGQTFFSSSQDNTLKVWQLHTGDLLSTFNFSNYFSCLAITANGQRLFSGSYDSTINIWECI